MKHSDINFNPGIACIWPVKGDICQARILFDGAMSPVELFSRGTEVEIRAELALDYPMVNIVAKQEYLCELDHINLFGCRSDAQSYVIPQEEVDRLSDTDISNILDETNLELDRIQETTDALLSTRIVENGPEGTQ